MQAGFWGVSPNYSSHFFSNGSKAMQSKAKAEETTTEHVRHHARVVYAAWIENVLIHFKRLLNSLKSSCTIKSFTYVTKGPFHSRTKQSTVHCENNYLYRSLLWLIRAIIWTGFDIALTQCKKLKSISGRCFTWYLLAYVFSLSGLIRYHITYCLINALFWNRILTHNSPKSKSPQRIWNTRLSTAIYGSEFLSISISLTELTGFIVVAYIFRGERIFRQMLNLFYLLFYNFGIA